MTVNSLLLITTQKYSLGNSCYHRHSLNRLWPEHDRSSGQRTEFAKANTATVLVQPHDKGKHSHRTCTTARQKQTQPPYLYNRTTKANTSTVLVQLNDKGKHSHHTWYNRTTKANTATVLVQPHDKGKHSHRTCTTAWQRQTQPPYLAKSHDKGKHSHHTLHNSREPQLNKPCLHTVGSWTRSKHRKGSKERYLLGKKTTSKLSG